MATTRRRGPLYTTVIDNTGPFFTHDPAKTFRANARSMLRQLGLEGERDIKAQLKAGESGRAIISNKVSPDRVSAHVTTGVPYTPTKSKTGAIQVNVYVPNFGMTKAQGKALMAAYGGLERRTHAFARTTRTLRSSRAVNAAELLKDIA
jgi:hypothetical protein